MTAAEALDRWSVAHEHLARKEMAMHSARTRVSQGEMAVELLEALQDEVVQLRHHSDSMLGIAMEMLRLEKKALAGKRSLEGR